jgi:hypothetical protein
LLAVTLVYSGLECRAATITATFHITERFGLHSLPGGIPVGVDRVQVAATVLGTGVTVTATQGGTVLNLPVAGLISPIVPNTYVRFINFDAGLTGSWTIEATDGGGTVSALTPPLLDPEFLPLVTDIQVTGPFLTPTLTWTVPDLTGFDVDQTRIRAIEADTGLQVFQDVFLGTGNTFTIPTGVLTLDKSYVFRISLEDGVIGHPVFGNYIENRSNAFSAVVTAVPEPGTMLLIGAGFVAATLARRRRIAE